MKRSTLNKDHFANVVSSDSLIGMAIDLERFIMGSERVLLNILDVM